MSQGIRLAVLGAGATGRAHAAGAQAAGGFRLTAADLIPDRLTALAKQFDIANTVADAAAIVNDPAIDAVCICLPTHLHAPIAVAALKAGKHVLIEFPPAPSSRDAKLVARAAEKAGRTVLYSAARRFGAAEQSAKQAIEKGYLGKIYHTRISLLRTRGIPRGTGWYTNREQSGGGAIIDLGLPLVDLLSYLASPARLSSGLAVAHSRMGGIGVEEAGSMLLKFDDGATAELSVAWALNQPPGQAGTVFRISGETGAIDLYTGQGPVLFRAFDDKGVAKATPLKQPKVAGHTALLRHFKDCIAGKSTPICGAADGVALMECFEMIYKSIGTGKPAHFQ
ncbi:MAG: Gfo/Idh/MocA family oxidoreductase [Burkholderiales bacterium]|nr:Gfo/Idh/MocA family oxidoreductase [Phycisphaerae bacterium]